MKIYIPKHLKSLEIIKNLCALIEEYGANPIENSNSSTINKFQDPVKNFISICSNGKLDEVMLGYYSNIFYCVKGTGKVFNYLIELIKLCNEDIEISCTYNMESIKIELSRIPYSNEVIFRDSLMDFLSSLIYFKEFLCQIGSNFCFVWKPIWPINSHRVFRVQIRKFNNSHKEHWS